MTPAQALIDAAEKFTGIGLNLDTSQATPLELQMLRNLELAIVAAKAAEEEAETKLEIRYRVDTVLFGKASPCSAAVKTREEAESYRLPIDRMTRIETREFIEVREKEGSDG